MPTSANTMLCANPDCDEAFEPNSWNQRYHSGACKRAVENHKRRLTAPPRMVIPAAAVADEDDIQSQIEFLRRENRRLANLADKHKNVKGELVKAVYDAASAALSKIEIKTVKPPRSRKSTGEEEVANPNLSDFQLGKVTSTYNSEVCAERIDLYADKVLELTEIQRAHHPIRKAHVYLLGDIVEGEDIFPGQSHLIDASLYGQVVHGTQIVADFLRRMLSDFEEVHVAAVIGNHGALAGGSRGRMYNPETNMDRMLYKFVSMMFQDDPRITFDIPEGMGEKNFYTVDYVGNYGTLLMHGDQFSTPTSMHAYYKKILGWKTGGIDEEFDDVVIGHWHQNTKATFGKTVLRIAGSPESNNTFAQEVIGVMGRPSQHLQFIHPRRGVTAEYDVYLDGQ